MLYRDSRLAGLLALWLLLLPFFLIGLWLQHFNAAPVFTAILLYIAIGRSSLVEHAEDVLNALLADDITKARRQVSYIVSRDTATINEQDIVNATIETVLENGNDAIFAAIFWAIIAGPTGVMIYRLINTLDAMWGYKNSRYFHFGWAAARLDDVMNFVPARLTALAYALAGNTKKAIHCWQEQGATWKSPNAGPVMAAGSGSLGIQLGGSASYHGQAQHRPPLGSGQTAQPADIQRSLKLIDRALAIWVAFLLLGFLLNTVLT